MRWIYISLLLVLSAFTAAASTAAEEHTDRSSVVTQPHLEARLLSEFSTISRGHLYTLAVELEPDAGWHTYWINPGDSGLATQIRWQAPEGSYFDDIQWPIAQKFLIGPLANYGFEDTTYLLTDFNIPADYPHDQVTITANVDWLVCEEYCIPGSAELSLTLDVGMPELSERNQPLFRTARNRLPEIADWPARFDIQGRQVTIIVESPEAVAMAQEESFYGFVGASELVEHAEEARIETTDDMLVIRRTLNTYHSEVPDKFILQLTHDNRSVELWVRGADQGPGAASAAAGGMEGGPGLALVLVFAFLGGLILNLMPCVFPVLSLKAMAIANSGKRQLPDALWYTAGVVLSFLVIAALLLALRAAGQALGWGFQLQNPWLIGTLVLLFVAIGLNLSGVFQFGTRLMGLGQSQVQSASDGSGAKGSFATGVLAVIIASPCTAPFMGVALGFAIVQPPAIALLIFAMLGIGLAFPFLALGLIPGAARVLPKPGAWMDGFKQWMAIPMYLTTVWLLWVFGRQAGVDSLAILLAAVVIFATLLWWHGRQQLQGGRTLGQRIGLLMFAGITVLLFWGALSLQQSPGSSSDEVDGRSWQAWTPERHEALKGEQPVFVNMTADWCITCLANERVALDTDATRALFAEHDIAYLKGDWTLQDPAITEYLSRYQRNGVPLYVLYWPGRDPYVLPQILTTGIVRDSVLAHQ